MGQRRGEETTRDFCEVSSEVTVKATGTWMAQPGTVVDKHRMVTCQGSLAIAGGNQGCIEDEGTETWTVGNVSFLLDAGKWMVLGECKCFWSYQNYPFITYAQSTCAEEIYNVADVRCDSRLAARLLDALAD